MSLPRFLPRARSGRDARWLQRDHAAARSLGYREARSPTRQFRRKFGIGVQAPETRAEHECQGEEGIDVGARKPVLEPAVARWLWDHADRGGIVLHGPGRRLRRPVLRCVAAVGIGGVMGQRHRFGCEGDQSRHEGPEDPAHAFLIGRLGEQVIARFTIGQRQVDVARQALEFSADLRHERSGLALSPAKRLREELEKTLHYPRRAADRRD